MSLLCRATRLVAALALVGAATIGATSEPAQAATQATHVAVAVDFGGGNVQVACVQSGGNGSAVLGADFRVQYNSVGLVAIINDVGSMSPPEDLYWSYWHGAGRSWSYASTGPGTFHPAAGTVEGWAYNDGKSGPAVAPSYASICAGQDAAPAPAPAPASTPHTSSTPAAQAGQRAQPDRSTAAAGGTNNGSPTSSRAGTSKPATHRSGKASTASGGAGAATSAAPRSTASSSAVLLASAPRQRSHPPAAPALGTVLALVAAATLGGAAFWRLRRRS